MAPFGGMGGPVPFAQSSFSLGQNSLYVYPFSLAEYVSCDIIRMPAMVTNSSSAAASVQKGLTMQLGIYTRNNSTQLGLLVSTTHTIAVSHNSNASWMLSYATAIGNSTSYNTESSSSAGLNISALLHGPREFIFPISSVFTPGLYYAAMVHSTSSAGAAGNVLAVSNIGVALQTFNRLGQSTNTSNTANFYAGQPMGVYSATTGALPASINNTQVNLVGSQPILYMNTGTV
jgi:hypothetical protein